MTGSSMNWLKSNERGFRNDFAMSNRSSRLELQVFLWQIQLLKSLKGYNCYPTDRTKWKSCQWWYWKSWFKSRSSWGQLSSPILIPFYWLLGLALVSYTKKGNYQIILCSLLVTILFHSRTISYRGLSTRSVQYINGITCNFFWATRTCIILVLPYSEMASNSLILVRPHHHRQRPRMP